MILRSIKDKIFRNFKVSVAEVDQHNNLQHAVIGVAFVSTNRRQAQATLDKLLGFLDNLKHVYIINTQAEFY